MDSFEITLSYNRETKELIIADNNDENNSAGFMCETSEDIQESINDFINHELS